MSQIVCRDVCLGYESCTVSKHVNFEVEAGDYLCIVGDNGSGKSTLMRALLRLKAPNHGDIILGEGIKRSDIGYLPQQLEAQGDFPASVREVVLSGCVARTAYPFATKAHKATAQENMKRLGIEMLASKPYRSLSGGQRQRVLLARSLCAAEKILLLDEPTSGLDPEATREFYEIIERFNRDLGITILMITHDLGAVARYANRVLHMSDVPTFYRSVGEYCESDAFLAGREDESYA